MVLFSYFLVLPAVCRALLNAFQEINVHLFDKVSFYSFFLSLGVGGHFLMIFFISIKCLEKKKFKNHL